MLTYQVRPRVFRIKSGETPTFPAQGEIFFHFKPPQPFGLSAGGGRTAIRGVAASALFNANSGEHTIESQEPLSPLDVAIEEPTRTLRLAGATLSIVQQFASIKEMEEVIESVYFALPTVLNVPFADPPYIERVEGMIGPTKFRWELAEWRMTFRTTTQEQQQARFAKAWERMGVVSAPHRRRLVAALHYFHVSCRLARAGCTAGEFVAEVILNLAKSLEVLFPPAGDGRTREAARAGLRTLGFTDTQIERDFIPAIALRNQIDVGHVELGLFTMDQLKTIHSFTEQAGGAFREMFERLLSRVETGQADVTPHELGPPKDEAIKLIERLKSSLVETCESGT
jgi:hypothetical protein